MSKIKLSKDQFEVFWEATVRYYELDPQGVMHNANHVAFFDQAITAYFKHESNRLICFKRKSNE